MGHVAPSNKLALGPQRDFYSAMLVYSHDSLLLSPTHGQDVADGPTHLLYRVQLLRGDGGALRATFAKITCFLFAGRSG